MLRRHSSIFIRSSSVFRSSMIKTSPLVLFAQNSPSTFTIRSCAQKTTESSPSSSASAKIGEKPEPSSESEPESSSPLGPSVTQVTEGFLVFFDEHWYYCAFFGILFLAFGIVSININERRAAKQNLLDDTLEPLIVSLSDDPSQENTPNRSWWSSLLTFSPSKLTSSANEQQEKEVVKFETPKQLDGVVFHAHGELLVPESSASSLQDSDLKISAPHCLKLERKVDMFQWLEVRKRKQGDAGKRDKGEDRYTYEYSRTWSDNHLRTRNNSNPEFPFYSRTKTAENCHLVVNKRRRQSSATNEDENNDKRKAIAEKSDSVDNKTVTTIKKSSSPSIFSSFRKTLSSSLAVGTDPEELPEDEAAASPLLKLRVSPDFMKRIDDWQSLAELITTDDEKSIREKYNLEPMFVDSNETQSGKQLILYTKGHNPDDPQIGDVRVKFQIVTEGTYTVLGMYKHREATTRFGITSEYPCGISPVKGKLKQTLVSQGEMVVPDEAHFIVKRTEKYHQQQKLSFSQSFLDFVERSVLRDAPLEFAYVRNEETDKKTAVANYREYQGKLTRSLLWMGVLFTSVGSGLLCYCAVPWMSEAALYRGCLLGMLIAFKTQDGAQKQLMARHLMANGGREGNNNSNSELDGEEVPRERVNTSELGKAGKNKGLLEL